MVTLHNVPLLGVWSVAAYRGGVDADGALQRRGRAALRRAGLDLRRNLKEGENTWDKEKYSRKGQKSLKVRYVEYHLRVVILE